MKVDVFRILHHRHIDSYQKSGLLIWVYQHPDEALGNREFAERLYIGDECILEHIIAELQEDGVLNCSFHCCRLSVGPGARAGVQCLADAFDKPLTRLRLIDDISCWEPHHYLHYDALESPPKAWHLADRRGKSLPIRPAVRLLWRTVYPQQSCNIVEK